jgi:tubby-related protein 1
VCLDPNDIDRDSGSCFVKVRSNFSGTEFTFYTSDRDHRRELGAVIYEVNPGGIRGPRRMTVIIPALASNGVAEEWWCKDDESPLLNMFKENPSSNRFLVLRNRAPQWSESLKGYQLNFGGRIGMASVKNFQLGFESSPPPSNSAALETIVDSGPEVSTSSLVNEGVIMQFGKWSNDRFSLDFRYPLNATQAFCIALTSFDNKLLCE